MAPPMRPQKGPAVKKPQVFSRPKPPVVIPASNSFTTSWRVPHLNETVQREELKSTQPPHLTSERGDQGASSEDFMAILNDPGYQVAPTPQKQQSIKENPGLHGPLTRPPVFIPGKNGPGLNFPKKKPQRLGFAKENPEDLFD